MQCENVTVNVQNGDNGMATRPQILISGPFYCGNSVPPSLEDKRKADGGGEENAANAAILTAPMKVECDEPSNRIKADFPQRTLTSWLAGKTMIASLAVFPNPYCCLKEVIFSTGPWNK